MNRINRFAGWLISRKATLATTAILLLAIAFNLYFLAPEVTLRPFPLNDNVFHLMNLKRTAQALAEGKDPTDFWLAPVGLGYPLFHHYQHLGYLPLAGLQYLSGCNLSLVGLIRWTNYLLLSLFPLSIYYAMRHFRFSRTQSALASLLAPLLSTPNLFGMDYASYIWRGSGLYTQLWAMLMLPLALVRGGITLRTGRGYFWAVVTLTGTLLSHLVTGYIAGLSLVVLAIFAEPDRHKLTARIGRLVLIAIATALVASYFLVPFWLDRAYMNRSVWEGAEKYGSFGYAWVFDALFKGELLDFGRFPSLTLLTGLGLVVCLSHWHKSRYRVPVLLAVLWLLLYFGRPTWGVLLDLLPLSKDMHFHRLILGLHLGAIFLMGIGLAALLKWSFSRSDIFLKIGVAVLIGLLLFPVYKERIEYLQQNTAWIQENEKAMAAEAGDLDRLIATLDALPPGRVYAGQGNNWGESYRVGSVPMYCILSLADFDMLGFNYHALSLNTDITVFFNDTIYEQYNLFNVRYLVAPQDQPVPGFAEKLGTFGRHALYQVETSGYFDLVDTPVGFSGSKADFYPLASAWLFSPLPAVKQHPALFFEPTRETEVPLLPVTEVDEVISSSQTASLPVQARGLIISEEPSEGFYQAQVEVNQESFLLLKVTYHPNWRVTLNGKPVTPMMVMPSYLGMKVGPGYYQVVAEYQPRPLRGGLQILGLLTIISIGFLEWGTSGLTRFWKSTRVEGVINLGRTWVKKLTTLERIQSLTRRIKPHTRYLVGVLILVILVGLPLFQLNLISGHDSGEYLPRSVEFFQGLRGGSLFPRWAPDLSAGYGQPFFNFNPPMFYYLTSLANLAGFNQVASQDLAILAILVLAAFGMYFLGADIFGRPGGLVVSAAYLFSPYMLSALYVRHALADFTAFAFIPFTIWGLYRFTRRASLSFLGLGALSISFLLLSSNPVSLITLPVLVFLVIWLSYQERSWTALWRGVGCLVLGTTLGAFFWLPALGEMKFTQLFLLKEGYLNYSNHFVYPSQLLYSPWGYGLSFEGPQDGMSFGVGLVYLLMASAALFLINRIRKRSKNGFLMIVFSLAGLALAAFFASTPSTFLWDRLPLLQNLEFPWRFLSLVSVSTAILFGFPFLLVSPEAKHRANWLAGFLILVLILAGFPKAKPEFIQEINDLDYSPQMIAAVNLAVTTAREYQPLWVEAPSVEPPSQPITLLEGNARLLTTRMSPTLLISQIDVLQPSRLQANINYFPGWTLKVDGIERLVDVSHPQGLMEFNLESGEHFIELSFEATPIRVAGRILSILAFCGLIATAWILQSRPKSTGG